VIAGTLKHRQLGKYSPQTLFYVLLAFASAWAFLSQMIIEYSHAFDHTLWLWINWMDSAPDVTFVFSQLLLVFFWAEINHAIVRQQKGTFRQAKRRIRGLFWFLFFFAHGVLFFGLLIMQVTNTYGGTNTSLFLARIFFPIMELSSMLAFFGYAYSLHRNIHRKFSIIPKFLKAQLTKVRIIALIWGLVFAFRVATRLALSVYQRSSHFNAATLAILEFAVTLERNVFPSMAILWILRRTQKKGRDDSNTGSSSVVNSNEATEEEENGAYQYYYVQNNVRIMVNAPDDSKTPLLYNGT